MEITHQGFIPLGASAAGTGHRLITQPHTAATLGNCSQCPGHFQALHRETVNTTPMGKRGFERKEPNRKNHVQKRRVNMKKNQRSRSQQQHDQTP